MSNKRDTDRDKQYQRVYQAKMRAQARAKREAAQAAAVQEWLDMEFRFASPERLKIERGDHEPCNVRIVEVGKWWGLADYYRGLIWLSRLSVRHDQKNEPAWDRVIASVREG